MSEIYSWSDFVASDRHEIETLTMDFIRDFSGNSKLSLEPKCGIGKTEAELDMIMWVFTHWDASKIQFVIAAPNHDLCNEIVDRLAEKGLPCSEIEHIYGKNQLCLHQPNHFLHTCKGCSDREVCPYIAQDWNTFVAVIPFQLIHMRGRTARRRILVYDECPFQNWILTQEIHPVDDNITLGRSTDILFSNAPMKVYPAPQMNDNFIVDSEHTNNIKHIMTTTNAHVVRGKDIHGRDVYTLFGQNMELFPDMYSKLVYSSATTPFSIREKMIGAGSWTRFQGKTEEQNPVIPVGRRGGLKQQKDFLPNFLNRLTFLMKEFKRLKGRDMKVFIATRKHTKDMLSSFAEKWGIDMVHYNQIGINTFNKDYDLAIAYGKMGFNYIQKYIYSQYLSSSEIETMEASTVVQALNRCRLILHRDCPVMLIKTNRDVMENNVYLRFTNDIFLKLDDLPFDQTITRKDIMDRLDCSEYAARAVVSYQRHVRNYILNGKHETITGLKQEGYEKKEIMEIMNISAATYHRKLNAEISDANIQFGEQTE